MKKRSVTPALALALALLLSAALPAPAMAAPSDDWLSGLWSRLATMWSAIPAGSETAPNMDPDGLSVTDDGETAPDMDPDGLSTTTDTSTEAAPNMDPDG